MCLQIGDEPLLIHRREAGIKTGRAALRAKAIELLREVGLDESALARHPHEFSGGQRQPHQTSPARWRSGPGC